MLALLSAPDGCMKAIMKSLRTTIAILLMQLASAHAALVTVDSPAGPASAVLDTTTRLEWLKLSATATSSIDQVFPQFAPGGTLPGFHFATMTEMCGLFPTNAGLGCFTGRSEDVARVQAFLSLFDAPVLRDGDGFISYFQVDPPELSNRMGFGKLINFYTEPVSYFETDAQLVTMDSRKLADPTFHWLVRDAREIPAPATWALIGIGVMALTSLRRKRWGR